MIGPCGESLVLSHFVQSIFSGSGMEREEGGGGVEERNN
jgi:hypothetical protein